MYNDSIGKNDKEFADVFSRFVNGLMGSAVKTGKELANDHRYLVNQKFKVVIAFVEQLAENYQKGEYDARNEWACKLASEIIENLKEKKLYYTSF